MKCPHCGLDVIKPSYKFCPSCRKPVNNIVVDEPQEQVDGDSKTAYKSDDEVIVLRYKDGFERIVDRAEAEKMGILPPSYPKC